MAIRKEIKIFVEFELRAYDWIKKEWEELQKEIIISRTNDNNDYQEKLGLIAPERGNGVTETKAIKLITNKRLAQLERTIKAIERIMMALPEEKYRLVVLKYWTKPQYLTDEGIAQELNIDRRTIYKWCDGILLALAKELGIIN